MRQRPPIRSSARLSPRHAAVADHAGRGGAVRAGRRGGRPRSRDRARAEFDPIRATISSRGDPGSRRRSLVDANSADDSEAGYRRSVGSMPIRSPGWLIDAIIVRPTPGVPYPRPGALDPADEQRRSLRPEPRGHPSLQVLSSGAMRRAATRHVSTKASAGSATPDRRSGWRGGGAGQIACPHS